MAVDLRNRTERRVFWTGEYDAAVIKALAAAIAPGSVVLDVGANIGFYAIGLARASHASVFAFEPMTSNAARLRRNVAANQLEARVQVLPYALGAEPGTIHLSFEADILGESVHPETGNAAPVAPEAVGAVAVDVRRLDDVAVELGVGSCALVKIDVEGGELAVLRGGQAFFTQHRPLVFAELNSYWMRQGGWGVDDLLALARAWNYDVTRWDGRAFSTLDVLSGGIDNVLLSPRWNVRR